MCVIVCARSHRTMCPCVCMSMCDHVYSCVWPHVITHVLRCVLCARSSVCMCMRVLPCPCVCMSMCVIMCMCAHVLVCPCVCGHACACVCVLLTGRAGSLTGKPVGCAWWCSPGQWCLPRPSHPGLAGRHRRIFKEKITTLPSSLTKLKRIKIAERTERGEHGTGTLLIS